MSFLSVVMLIATFVVMLSVILLNVVRVNVAAPQIVLSMKISIETKVGATTFRQLAFCSNDKKNILMTCEELSCITGWELSKTRGSMVW